MTTCYFVRMQNSSCIAALLSGGLTNAMMTQYYWNVIQLHVGYSVAHCMSDDTGLLVFVPVNLHLFWINALPPRSPPLKSSTLLSPDNKDRTC